MHNPFLATFTIWQNLSDWYQQSLICEILTYLENTYFSVDFNQYQNFSVSSSTGGTVRNIILGIALGLIIAAAMTVYTKQVLGGFVRKLIRNGCTSPDQAKTLLELGYFQSPSIRHELKRGVTLCKLVCCKEEKEEQLQLSEETSDQSEKPAKKPFVIDFATMHFYIPEELRYRAEVRFEQKGSSWAFFAVFTIATIIASAFLCIFMPDVFQLADNLITLLS